MVSLYPERVIKIKLECVVFVYGMDSFCICSKTCTDETEARKYASKKILESGVTSVRLIIRQSFAFPNPRLTVLA